VSAAAVLVSELGAVAQTPTASGGCGGGGGAGGGAVLYSVVPVQVYHSRKVVYVTAVPFMEMIAPCHGASDKHVEPYQPM